MHFIPASASAILFGASILLLGVGLLGTLVPVRSVIEGFTTGATGLIVAGYFLGMATGSVLCRRIVQRVGHIRAFSAFASLISGIAILHAFAVSVPFWIALRFATGFCLAGLYLVTEAWLNAIATNETRGRILSIYMITSYGAMGAGQFLLLADDPATFRLFGLTSVLFSFALIPVALTRTAAPVIEEVRSMSWSKLYAASPTGVLTGFTAGMVLGIAFGLGPVYAKTAAGGAINVAYFMGALMIAGLIFQWPIGRLSDKIDRRRVIFGVAAASGAIALAAGFLPDADANIQIAIVAAFGAFALSLYSLGLAYTNDYIEPADLVPASAGLILTYSAGSAVGPFIAGFVMEYFGPGGFFFFLSVVTVGLGLFIAYRMSVRQSLPSREQSQFVAMPRMAAEVAQLDPRGEDMPEAPPGTTPRPDGTRP